MIDYDHHLMDNNNNNFNNNYTSTSSNVYTSLELTRENNIKRNNEFLYQLFGNDNINKNNNSINNTTTPTSTNIHYNHKESKEEQEKREINNIIQNINYISQQKSLLKKQYLHRDNEINELFSYLTQVL